MLHTNAFHRLTLKGEEESFVAFTRADGQFTFYDVPPGVYLLEALSSAYQFSHAKVKVPEESTEPIQVLEYAYPGAMKQQGVYPINLRSHRKWNYFQARPKPGLLSILRGPMAIPLLVMALGVGLPKLLANIDPEAMEEAKKMQAARGAKPGANQAPDVSLSEMLAGFMGTGADADEPPATQARPVPRKPQSSGPGKKKNR